MTLLDHTTIGSHALIHQGVSLEIGSWYQMRIFSGFVCSVGHAEFIHDYFHDYFQWITVHRQEIAANSDFPVESLMDAFYVLCLAPFASAVPVWAQKKDKRYAPICPPFGVFLQIPGVCLFYLFVFICTVIRWI